MAFIYCNKCDWQQTDFFSEHFNPAKYLLHWNKTLFGEERKRLDEKFTTQDDFIEEHGNITTREVIARDFERFGQNIRTMKWVTYEDWEKENNAGTAKCPKCGCSDAFGID